MANGSGTRAWRQWWWIYRPRIAWYLALPLLVLVAPRYLFEAAVEYMVYCLGLLVLCGLGAYPTLVFHARYAQPWTSGWMIVDFLIGCIGVALAVVGVVCQQELVQLLGVVSVFVAIDCALFSREANCRHLLTPQRGR